MNNKNQYLRKGFVERTTKETAIKVELVLDEEGVFRVAPG